MSDRPQCACLRVTYAPTDVMVPHPLDPSMPDVEGKSPRWVCDVCFCDFQPTEALRARDAEKFDEGRRAQADPYKRHEPNPYTKPTDTEARYTQAEIDAGKAKAAEWAPMFTKPTNTEEGHDD